MGRESDKLGKQGILAKAAGRAALHVLSRTGQDWAGHVWGSHSIEGCLEAWKLGYRKAKRSIPSRCTGGGEGRARMSVTTD